MQQTSGDLAQRDKERHILAAVDGSENSRRTVQYLADFFSDYPDVFITLLTVVPRPLEDYFNGPEELKKWRDEQQRQAEKQLAAYTAMLSEAGFDDERIRAQVELAEGASAADAILAAQDKLRCCIVVVGRRGISRREEFLFGSTSNRILHHAKNCAVLVVE